MPTLTIRNVPEASVKALKKLARKNKRSMEQEVRELIEQRVPDRLSALEQLDAIRARQKHPTTLEEIENWITIGRP